MVAMPQLDLVITAAWVGLLVAALLGQAVWAWLGCRRAARYAREAARLARATRPVTGPARPIAQPESPKRVSA